MNLMKKLKGYFFVEKVIPLLVDQIISIHNELLAYTNCF